MFPIWRDVYALPAQVIPEHRDNVLQVDPWEKAADCERALRVTFDPLNRNRLKDIRDFGFTGLCKAVLERGTVRLGGRSDCSNSRQGLM
jgi:hypothetical protein